MDSLVKPRLGVWDDRSERLTLIDILAVHPLMFRPRHEIRTLRILLKPKLFSIHMRTIPRPKARLLSIPHLQQPVLVENAPPTPTVLPLADTTLTYHNLTLLPNSVFLRGRGRRLTTNIIPTGHSFRVLLQEVGVLAYTDCSWLRNSKMLHASGIHHLLIFSFLELPHFFDFLDFFLA